MKQKYMYHLERELDANTVGYWAVVGPGIHEPFDDMLLAKKIASWLNAAYNLGYLTKFKDENDHDKTI